MSGATYGVARMVTNIDGKPIRSCMKGSRVESMPVISGYSQASTTLVVSCAAAGTVSDQNPKLVGVSGHDVAAVAGSTSDGALLGKPNVVSWGQTGPQILESMTAPNSTVCAESGSAPNPTADVTRSYAATVLNAGHTRDKSAAKINFREFDNEIKQQGADVVISHESMRLIKDKFANTLYGYFLGDKLSYPVVDYFVRMKWKKFGLQKPMMNNKGLFFFKFSDRKGMLDVLDEGPWLIRNKPIFLNIWSPTAKLNKEDIVSVAVWVKLHNVPIAAYSDDGLSPLATKLGKPKHLDSHTSSMCRDVWGRCSYARALIEISADHALKDHLMVVIPDDEGDTFAQVRVDVEFEWTPPRCENCFVFGHNTVECPKHVKPTTTPTPTVVEKDPKANGDGSKGKKEVKHTTGQTTKKAHVEWRPVVGKSRGARKKLHTPSTSGTKKETTNNFAVLSTDVETSDTKWVDGLVASDEEDDSEVYDVGNETGKFMARGASTPLFKWVSYVEFSSGLEAP